MSSSSSDRAARLDRTIVAGSILTAAFFVVTGAGPSATAAPDPRSSASASPSPAPPPLEGAEPPPPAERPPELLRLDAEAQAPATTVRLAPSARGVLGAWLIAGPFRAGKPALDAPPQGLDERTLASPMSGAVVGTDRDLAKGRRPAARWNLVSSGPPVFGSASQDPGREGSRTIDLKASLDDAGGSDLVAYAYGRIHVENAGRHYLALGVDDGVRVSVDGAVVLSRDSARPVRDDDDVIPLDLGAGDHDVLLKLHQREGAWAFRARFVDAAYRPGAGTYLELPGTTADDARALAGRMSWLVVDRTFDPSVTPARYRPVLTVRYPEGVPRGVPLPVRARFYLPSPASPAPATPGSAAPASASAPAGEPLFDVNAGGATVNAEGATDLVVALPSIDPWTGSATLEASAAGRTVRSSFVARPASEQALARADRALGRIAGDEPWLLPGSLDSVRFLARRLARLVASGDGDTEAQAEEARELDRLAANLERGVDPYAGQSGMMRRALVTPFDGAPSEYGLYVPPSYKPGTDRRYPLVVVLHGMNSYALSILRALFGLDDEKKEPAWKDRHLVPVPAVEAFVIAPNAHGNTMYREIGEDDVLYLTEWAKRVFPIDEGRITVTGPSMGGIGSASLPFHFPHVFAAAMPLCGYHSYLIRPDLASRLRRPWERLLLEERSNVLWAENGEHLPLYVVHGTRDLPETNSGVLIERYEKLGYPIKHEHPDAGHNVWGISYGELKGLKWLLGQRLDPHPAHVRFRTMRTRYGTSAWVTVDELAGEATWADVDARAKGRSAIQVTTSQVAALTLTRDARVFDDGPIAVTIDNTLLRFEPGEALAMHRAPGWTKGPRPAGPRLRKSGHVAGPIRDAFHEPLLFVYGAEEDARVNERVARGFADRSGAGIHTGYKVMSDRDFFAHGEPLANDRALFLVGRANKVLAAIEAASGSERLPIRIEAGAVVAGKERFTGKELGAAFIHPNPMRPDRYIVVVGGADVPGTLRALALPELVPDFVVWDEGLAPARGQILLFPGTIRAGGFFTREWSLPAAIVDPLAGNAARPRTAPAAEVDPSSESP